MKNFDTLGLPETLLHALKAINFNVPTPIQEQTIPHALEGKDVLGSAQTGTGKTGAFGIPLVTHVMRDPHNHALVLAPTRELALQVLATIKLFLGKSTKIKTATLIGGEAISKQFIQLKMKPQIIVGTPGRVNDHLIRETLDLSRANFFVLDEFDRMLDMGFSIQLERIEEYLPKERQTLMFSATMAPNILKLANSYLIDPVRVAVGSTTSPTETIKQEQIKTTEENKYSLLLDKLNENQGTVIVFVKTKFSTEKLAKKLKLNGHEAEAIHGDLRQHKRESVIRSFRAKKNRILVATDVAARGLDINHVECVINYDLPQCPEDYIHRIGRTGRAGAEGIAISLITSEDSQKWRNIARLMDPTAKFEKEPASSRARSKKPSGSRGGKFSFDSKGKERNKSGFAGRNKESSRFGSEDKPREKSKFGFGDKPRERNKAGFDDKNKFEGRNKEKSKFGFGDKPRERNKAGFEDKNKFEGRNREKTKFDFGDKPRERNKFGSESKPREKGNFGFDGQSREKSNFGFGDKNQERNKSGFDGKSKFDSKNKERNRNDSSTKREFPGAKKKSFFPKDSAPRGPGRSKKPFSYKVA